MSVIICLRKSTSEIGLEFLVWFSVSSVSLTFFMKILINQEHNLLPDRACGPGFSAFVLNLSKSGNILFRSMPKGNCLFSSASLSLVGDNSLVHELRVIAAVELHVNATYCVQHLHRNQFMKKVNR